jgi:hypothetical protein
LQDYAILQTANVSRDDEKLSSIKSYKNFPKSEEWIRTTLTEILENASQMAP